MFGKDAKKKELIKNLDNLYGQIQIPEGASNIPWRFHSDPFGRKSSKKSSLVWKYILSFLLSIKGHFIPF